MERLHWNWRGSHRGKTPEGIIVSPYQRTRYNEAMNELSRLEAVESCSKGMLPEALSVQKASSGWAWDLLLNWRPSVRLRCHLLGLSPEWFVTLFSLFFAWLTLCRRRQWHPTPVLLPGKSHGRRGLVGCSPWVPRSQTRLSDFTFTFHFHALEKEMATHSSILALENPRDGGAWWAAVYGVAWSRTRLKWLSSSSSSSNFVQGCVIVCHKLSILVNWIFTALCIFPISWFLPLGPVTQPWMILFITKNTVIPPYLLGLHPRIQQLQIENIGKKVFVKLKKVTLKFATHLKLFP